WNPYITRASGYARAGSVLELRLEPPGGAPQTVEPKVLTVRHLRKLRWQRRALAPGILDQEHEFRLYRLGPKRVRLVHDVRYEGVLAPFADLGEASRGFDLMCAALEQRAKELAPRS
ncbi:MAG: SRPBCC domain-containing protein, partial [Gaiellaceae bacterium]